MYFEKWQWPKHEARVIKRCLQQQENKKARNRLYGPHIALISVQDGDRRAKHCNNSWVPYVIYTRPAAQQLVELLDFDRPADNWGLASEIRTLTDEKKKKPKKEKRFGTEMPPLSSPSTECTSCAKLSEKNHRAWQKNLSIFSNTRGQKNVLTFCSLLPKTAVPEAADDQIQGRIVEWLLDIMSPKPMTMWTLFPCSAWTCVRLTPQWFCIYTLADRGARPKTCSPLCPGQTLSGVKKKRVRNNKVPLMFHQRLSWRTGILFWSCRSVSLMVMPQLALALLAEKLTPRPSAAIASDTAKPLRS